MHNGQLLHFGQVQPEGNRFTLSIMLWKGIIDPMKFKPVIAASILAADFSRLGEEINAAEEGGAQWIHVDVMDGHFVPNLTMGPMIVEACRRVTNLPLDVHLMMEEPERLLSDFARAGASRLTVHVETCPHLHQTLRTIQELDVSAGVALNPSTPFGAITEILEEVDLILIMTVNPGFGGQKLIDTTLRKVERARELLISKSMYDIHIEVDGGIDTTTIQAAASAGADIFVAGTAVFKHPSGTRVGIQSLMAALEVEGVKK
jgi:ribulose-phosphate 3-epimerase